MIHFEMCFLPDLNQVKKVIRNDSTNDSLQTTNSVAERTISFHQAQ